MKPTLKKGEIREGSREHRRLRLKMRRDGLTQSLPVVQMLGGEAARVAPVSRDRRASSARKTVSEVVAGLAGMGRARVRASDSGSGVSSGSSPDLRSREVEIEGRESVLKKRKKKKNVKNESKDKKSAYLSPVITQAVAERGTVALPSRLGGLDVRRAMTGVYLTQGESLRESMGRAGFSESAAVNPAKYGISEEGCIEEAKKFEAASDPANLLSAARSRFAQSLAVLDPQTARLGEVVKALEVSEKYYGKRELPAGAGFGMVVDRMQVYLTVVQAAQARGVALPGMDRLPARRVSCDEVEKSVELTPMSDNDQYVNSEIGGDSELSPVVVVDITPKPAEGEGGPPPTHQ